MGWYGDITMLVRTVPRVQVGTYIVGDEPCQKFPLGPATDPLLI